MCICFGQEVWRACGHGGRPVKRFGESCDHSVEPGRCPGARHQPLPIRYEFTDKSSTFNVHIRRGNPDAEFSTYIGGARDLRLNCTIRNKAHTGRNSDSGQKQGQRGITVRILVKGITDGTEPDMVNTVWRAVLRRYALAPNLGAG